MTKNATYLLPTEDRSQQICFYIHDDGCLRGATRYFYKMYQCKNGLGGLAGSFFRSNLNADFASCHEEHENTAFKYKINHQNILTAW